ncbi:UDPglucose 6-dehydrogenase [Crossiella equi]|uniref:UDP-glucose 6-dehydrogenase n=1 Tax=Crossiella equi TaxID=130796 RepID=A0ABS5A712_9PSEU|nr:UDP-glucose/GDP-mannose dehydrogenase family protein [Crossiella equi]MBP2472022.1 UDPglucose 6-dehydrogenase [Crossiella equi]
MSPVVSVIGTGYLGATHAACLAELGYQVVGVDTDADKIAALTQGRLPFYEPGLPELLAEHVRGGALRFTTDITEAAKASVHFLCVGTPQDPRGHAADLRFVHAAVDALVPALRTDALIVGKSTVPVGTAAALADRAARLAEGVRVDLVWNPEFLREGHAVADTLRPDRIVIGGPGKAAAALLEVYAPLLAEQPATPVITTDYASAELVKTAANAFLATKISYINMVADLCEAAGADITVVADALGHDVRIGRPFLNAGLGFGGGCLPKDLRAFHAAAAALDVRGGQELLRQVDHINNDRRSRLASLAERELGGSVLGAHIAVLGAAFKPGSDDVRDSPALNVAASLHLRGARVRVYDPQALANARKEFPTLGYAESATEALTGADLVLHVTEWPEFAELDPVRVGQLVQRRVVVDGRNSLDRHRWAAAGWRVVGMGRPPMGPASA